MLTDRDILLEIKENQRVLTRQMNEFLVFTGKLEAYDIPSLQTQVQEQGKRIEQSDTRIKTWGGFMGFVGFIFGGFILELGKRWLS